MSGSVGRRLPEVKTLYEILPSGVEGGKEFARIVDLLLFHEARKNGKKITIFNDAAGDYHGLDSFEGDIFRKDGTTGYQYKFYPSPLSNDHRSEIVSSLLKAVKDQNKLMLKKWILVTPQDFIESSSRRDGGDVTWFEFLRKKFNLQFELEHWGHTQLKSLLIETPSICLYYYPELINEGVTRRKTIQDIRSRYDDALCATYQKIEFVGMSVYKDVTAKRIPIEHIYIPLSITSVYKNGHNNKINPLSLLKFGSKNVILGDPGSGKSTLLRFLALSGTSEALQIRYQAQPNKKLPILVTLRRYVDELKKNNNLSLIDYIRESIHADFSLKSADLIFFEYYLESGQTIILFDGLDELPNPYFKKEVRDRILTLNATYPGNTLVVTSRIVGYDDTFSFDEREFAHYKLTRLELPAIEQFVRDWYNVRIENKREREDNINDLIRVLKNRNNKSIRELAENPLLLTIIILVHRIDAVLPDERIILYKKCTETLLNSWYTSKYQRFESKNRGKIERRNLRRLEAVAYWMHTQSNRENENQHAIISHKELCNYLTEYIMLNEKTHLRNEEPEDLAGEFLEFVKKRTGLLIEIGDNLYGFIHLTFQEYLSACYIINSTEVNGAIGCWNAIKDNCTDAGWNEIIRLLVARLESEKSQEFIITNILSLKCEKQQYENISLLLSGLLIDGVESAYLFEKEIFEHLLTSAVLTADARQYKNLISIVQTFLNEGRRKEDTLFLAFESIWEVSDYEMRKSLTLIAFCISCEKVKDFVFSCNFLEENINDSSFFKLFFDLPTGLKDINKLEKEFALFCSIQDTFSLTSGYCNFISAAGQAMTSSFGLNIIAKRTFEELMIVLSCGFNSVEFFNYMYYTLLITSENGSRIKLCRNIKYNYYDKVSTDRKVFEPFIPVLIGNSNREFNIADSWECCIAKELVEFLCYDQSLKRDFVCNIFKELSKRWNISKELNIDTKYLDSLGYQKNLSAPHHYLCHKKDKDNTQWWRFINGDDNNSQTYESNLHSGLYPKDIRHCRSIIKDQNSPFFSNKKSSDCLYLFNYLKYKSLRAFEYQSKDGVLINSTGSNEPFWQLFLSMPELYTPLLELLCDVFDLKPRIQWLETLRTNFLPKIPQKISILDKDIFKNIETAYEEKNVTETEIYLAASYLIFDSWLYAFKYYETPEDSMFKRLADLTREIDALPIKIAHSIRDLAYGDKSKINELKKMVISDSQENRSIFEFYLWKPPIDKKMSLENHFYLWS